MLNILSAISNFITGTINDVKNWIIKLLQAVYSYIDTEFHAIESEITSVWNELYPFIKAVEQYAETEVTALGAAITQEYHDIINWTTDAINDVDKVYTQLSIDVTNWINDLRNDIAKAYDDIENWAQTHIWNPLYNAITDAAGWISKEGAYVYDLLTHPDKLASFLGKYLWQSSLDLTKQYAKPIGNWLMHSMIGMAGEIADVLEDILSALI